ncbi:MAG TPA: hypothetical protein IAA29_00680 [Candidatus Paenibacillus intestinavium]|nr:hypothetical protein [Candidatus Paenibacillus intestinavium]
MNEPVTLKIIGPITIMVFTEDGGQEYTALPKSLVGELAQAIATKGSETIQLESGKTWEVVGFMIYSKQIGERVIITGQGGQGDE